MGIMDTLRRITLVEMVTGQDQVDFGPLRLPSHEKLRALDQAHEQGFRAFLSDIGHDGRNVGHRHWASNALVALMNGVQGQGPDVDYDDPYTAAAYLVKYHLRHCILAYWAFKEFFDQEGVPDALYVCDVGAGTGSARVGLALALLESRKDIAVYFDAFEPSHPTAMRAAGARFWESLSECLPDIPDYFYRESGALPNEVPSDLPYEAERMVTAFHLSLPYDSGWDYSAPSALSRRSYGGFGSRQSSSALRSARDSVWSALDLVSPDVGIFTAHGNKRNALREAIDFSGWGNRFPDRYDIPDDGNGFRQFDSRFYTNCAVDLGFDVSEGAPVNTWSVHRFSPPSTISG